MPSLQVLSNDPRQTREIAFTSDEVTIGRDADNVLVLDGAKVSRRHARVLATPRGYMLVDADSSNGVFVGQERIRHHFLTSGTIFQIGKHLIRFVDEDAVAPTLVDSKVAAAARASVVAAAAAQRVPQAPASPAHIAPPGEIVICSRCGVPRPYREPSCSACGTSVRPPVKKPTRWLLWIVLFFALCALALMTAIAAYVFRDAWFPALRRLVTGPAEVKTVAPELADFGQFAKVRKPESELQVGPGASSHALDESARLEIPAGALTKSARLVSSVVDLGAERADANVRSSLAYIVSAPEGTELDAPLVIEIAKPTALVSVTEAYAGGWRPVELLDGPVVRIPIEHFSRRTFAVVEWKEPPQALMNQAPAVIMMDGSGDVSSPPPGMLGDSADLGPQSEVLPQVVPRQYGPAMKTIRDDPRYRQFTGAEPNARYFPGRPEFCAVLTKRAMSFPGLSFDRPKLDGVEVPRPEAGLPNGTPFEQLMIAAVDPASQNKNPYVRLTNDPGPDGKSLERRLEDAILASSGNLTPADIMEMSLQVSGGNYKLASLTAHNLLKNIAYQGRQQGALVAGMIARGRTDIEFPERYGNVASRLVNLRSGPGDKMGIWYHAFVPLAISAWTDPGEADWAITQEYVVRWLGSLTNMGSPMDPEKQASDRCFAESARDIHNQRPSTSAPGEKVPTTNAAPPPPPPPPPAPRDGADLGTPCEEDKPVARKCPWTPEGYSVGLCGKGYCWDGGPQGSGACKQERSVDNAGRTYTTDLVCNQGFTAIKDRCTNEILSCQKL